MIKEQISISN